MSTISHALSANGLLTAFAFVGVIMWFSNAVSKYLTFGRIHGSAIGILIGLALAFWAGLVTGGQKGLADLPVLAGIGLMGGAMLRDFAIVATAFEVDVAQVRRAGLIGAVAIGLGTLLPFLVGVCAAFAFGYRDAVSLTTIGAGAITYIVGPVTGAALGASSAIMALSIATGVLKAILVMIGTPLVAGADRPEQSAQRHGVRRTDGHGERRFGRPCGNRPAACALWLPDRDFPYRRRLPGCAVHSFSRRARRDIELTPRR